jgi:hypothetical protein
MANDIENVLFIDPTESTTYDLRGRYLPCMFTDILYNADGIRAKF